MPNTLDVAVQRKLIADLERDGRSTQEAEVRLKSMLAQGIWKGRSKGMRAERPAKYRPLRAAPPCGVKAPKMC